MGLGRVFWRGCTAVALAALALCCSLTTSLDDLTGGGDADAAVTDTGFPADTTTPPSDAGADGSDASPANDAAKGDADAADAADARWCATQTSKFCEDFDDPSGVWSPQLTPGATIGATVALDKTTGRSAPGSFVLTTDGTSKEGATLTFSIPATSAVKKVTFAYDMRIDTYADYAEIGYVRFTSGQTELHSHYLRLTPSSTWLFTSKAYLPDGSIPQDYLVAGPPADAGTWIHVVETIDLVALSSTIRIDGKESTRSLDPIFPPAAGRVLLGFGFTPNDNKSWTAHFDDMTIDWE